MTLAIRREAAAVLIAGLASCSHNFEGPADAFGADARSGAEAGAAAESGSVGSGGTAGGGPMGGRTDAAVKADGPASCSAPCWVETSLGKHAVASLAMAALAPGTIYAGSPDSARLWKSLDRGASWVEQLFGIEANQIAIDPMAPDTVYVTDGHNVRKTVNGGGSWIEAGGEGAGGLSAVALDPANRRTVFIGVEHGWGVYKSTDGATTFRNVLPDVHATALAVSSSQPGVVYAGAADYEPGEAGGVFRSTNAGESWIRVLTSSRVHSLAVTTAGLIFAGTATQGLYRGSNGAELSRVTSLPPVDIRAIAPDPRDPSIVYVGTWEEGVWKSTDAGATWSSMNAGLINPFVLSVIVDPTEPGTLYSGTKGNGVFRWK